MPAVGFTLGSRAVQLNPLAATQPKDRRNSSRVLPSRTWTVRASDGNSVSAKSGLRQAE
jgi:hypothetical protein